MDTKTLFDLAYYRIRDIVAKHCVSQEGADFLQAREPLTDSTQIEALKAYSHEWSIYLHAARSTPFASWQPVAALLHVAKAEGASLTVEQLYAVYQFCNAAKSVHAAVTANAQQLELTTLAELANSLPIESIQMAFAAITRIIDVDGSLKDLPALRAIRAKIASIQAEIAHELRRYTSDTALNNVLEANVPAYRADRQVLAVKASQKTRIHGIVHEVSNSGQTVFIEPEEVVRKNNELIQEEFHLQQETRKICQETTAQLQPLSADLRAALETMLLFDSTLAAARWGIETRGTYALPCAESDAPLLLQAYHPLLGAKAVPIDLQFLPQKRVLIITGPNTGGKTVTLKTFALFAMLNQSGFPIPAAEGTRLPIFSTIFADIGDEQSIDQSLSTFSAHMKNIAHAIEGATSNSLVLLDELGSGTDPQEGGAIAMSVLDTLIEKHAFVLVTTHHGILKNYGYTNSACINASVAFDAQTLSPTYRLVMGVPGESHALDIAERSGLADSVVAQAKRYLAGEEANVSKLINGLIAKHAEADALKQSQEETAKKQKDVQLKQDLRELRLRQHEYELKEREHRQESTFVRETRRELENLVRTLREGEITREKTLAVKQFIANVSEDLENAEKALAAEDQQLAEAASALEERIKKAKDAKERGVRSENGILLTTDSGKRTAGKSKKTHKKLSNKEAFAQAKSTYSEAVISQLSPQKQKQAEKPQAQWIEGAEVFAGPSRSRGTLIRKERKGVWTVQLGSIRMSVRERDMVLVPQTASGEMPKASVSIELSNVQDGENAIFMKSGAEARPVFELNLLGMRAEEAVKVLQRQLDLCSMQNFKTFSVVHGKGTGVLQQAVQDYLASYPVVKEYHFARPEEGGTGKTYVTLG